MAAFGRHPTTSKLVWSSKVGYPADYNYREYYRDIGFELDAALPRSLPVRQRGPRRRWGSSTTASPVRGRDKHLYNPDWAGETAERHARDFVGPLAATRPRAARSRMPFPAVVVSPYDAELFGHWWFEGPQWIYHVLRELANGGPLAAGTPGGYLAAHPIQQAMPAPAAGDATATTSTGSTRRPIGCGGRSTRPRGGCPVAVQEHIDHGERPDPTPRGWRSAALCQAGRELMLAQSSDWPFIITNGTTEEYARRRFHDHLHRFHELMNCLERQRVDVHQLEALEYMDAIFPELDYRLFAPAGGAVPQVRPHEGAESPDGPSSHSRAD